VGKAADVGSGGQGEFANLLFHFFPFFSVSNLFSHISWAN
jgi:hypothetical protein